MNSALSGVLSSLEKASATSGMRGVAKGNRRLTDLLGRLRGAVDALEAKSPSGGGGGGNSAKVQAYDAYVAQYVNPVIALSSQIGVSPFGNLADLGDRLKETFAALRACIVYASGHRKPPASSIPSIPCFSTLRSDQKEWDDINFESKRLAEGNHYTSCFECTKIVSFVFIRDTPASFVKDCMDQMTFYTTKVLREFRTKEPKHGEFVDGLKGIITGMMNYVKANHMTGLSWNPRGA